MSGVFFDTNVLVYRFAGADVVKRLRAHELWTQHVRDGAAVISTQVMTEFAAACTQGPAPLLGWRFVHEELERLAELNPVVLRGDDLVRAAERRDRLAIGWWDALILEAAIRGGCARMYSEGFQHGRSYDGVVVENPFGEKGMVGERVVRAPKRGVKARKA